MATTEVTSVTERTATEQAFIDAYTNALLVDTERDRVEDAAHAAGRALSDEGKGDNALLLSELAEAAIAASGLPDDNRHVQRIRKATRLTLQIAEAIDNGMDKEEAAVIAMLGGDPRRTDPFDD